MVIKNTNSWQNYSLFNIVYRTEAICVHCTQKTNTALVVKLLTTKRITVLTSSLKKLGPTNNLVECILTTFKSPAIWKVSR